MLLFFDASAIKARVGSGRLASARVELTLASVAHDWGWEKLVGIHRLEQPSAEYQATWNCALDANVHNQRTDCSGASAWSMSSKDPALQPWLSPPTATAAITAGQTGKVSFDVTTDVAALLAGSSAGHGWLLEKVDDNASGALDFASRELGQGPRLLLEVDGAQGGASPGAATGSPTLNNARVHDAGRSSAPPATCVNGMLMLAGHCAAEAASCVTSERTPVACAGGLACADATSCKSTCTTRLDCASTHAECKASSGTCEPDAVSVAASARGVRPSRWVPQVQRTPAQMAALLRGLGVDSDAQGRILFKDLSMAGMTPAFDPERRTPVTGFHNCIDRLQACQAASQPLDECVAAAPRCASTTPWLDDPAGFDCCPSECLLEYFDRRENARAGLAMIGLINSFCYPGLRAYLESLR